MRDSLPFDARAFRDACGAFPTGVTVVTAEANGKISGMTANAFMSISVDPPLVAVSLGLKARTLGVIREAGRFAVAILPVSAESVAWHFAGRPQDGMDDPFERLDGQPVARGAAAAFATTIEQDIIAGDHAVLIGRVTALRHRRGTEPLVFSQGRFVQIAIKDPGPMSSELLQERLFWGFGTLD